MSRRAIAAVLALASLAATAIAAAPATDEAVLRKFKTEDWPRAYSTQNVELLGSMLADTFQVVDGDGNWSTKRAEIDWLAKNQWKNDGFVYTIKRLDIYGGDTAIIAGEGRITFKTGDQPRIETYQSTNVLVKENGTWRAVASHISGGKSEPLPR
jgi:hypothetical protein